MIKIIQKAILAVILTFNIKATEIYTEALNLSGSFSYSAATILTTLSAIDNNTIDNNELENIGTSTKSLYATLVELTDKFRARQAIPIVLEDSISIMAQHIKFLDKHIGNCTNSFNRSNLSAITGPLITIYSAQVEASDGLKLIVNKWVPPLLRQMQARRS